jgi:hypothetical protein
MRSDASAKNFSSDCSAAKEPSGVVPVVIKWHVGTVRWEHSGGEEVSVEADVHSIMINMLAAPIKLYLS